MAISKPMMGRNKVNGRGSEDAKLKEDIAYDYRRVIGDFLRDCRMKAGLTQADVGKSLGVGATHISGIELGRSSLAPEHYEIVAKLFDISRRELGEFLLRYTNPWLYALIYGKREANVKTALDTIPERIGQRRQDSIER